MLIRYLQNFQPYSDSFNKGLIWMAEKFFLKPFRTFLRCPDLKTPLSTFTLPPLPISIGIIIASFMFIAGGLVLCTTQGIPMVGYIVNRQGEYITSWIDSEVIGQFMGEGVIVGMIYLAGSISFIAGYEYMTAEDKSQIFPRVCKYIAFTLPLWFIALCSVFRKKIEVYFPSPFPMARM